MTRRRTGRRNTRALNARLDCELDSDLINWLEALPSGRRSDAIRDGLRMGLRSDSLRTDLEGVIRSTIQEALANLQVVAAQQGIEFDKNEVEEAFGTQLDKLLGSFG
jgi:hypothetical protein